MNVVRKPPGARRKPITHATEFSPGHSPSHDAIAQAAYFLAERRGFLPGHELEDWLEAERELSRSLTSKEAAEASAEATH